MKKWLLAIVITLALSIYQRMTGPTHPKRVTVELNGERYTQKLPRSGVQLDEIVTLKDLPEDAIVQLHYRRFPVQPVAGKLQYYISVNGKKYPAEEPLLIRFRNDVPAHILVPHILFMFASMLFAVYTFLLVVTHKPYMKWLWITVGTLFIGGSCGLRSLVGRLSLWHRPDGQ